MKHRNNEPFWIEIDIHGGGKRWELAFLNREHGQTMIKFPMSDFEDYWDEKVRAKILTKKWRNEQLATH